MMALPHAAAQIPPAITGEIDKHSARVGLGLRTGSRPTPRDAEQRRLQQVFRVAAIAGQQVGRAQQRW